MKKFLFSFVFLVFAVPVQAAELDWVPKNTRQVKDLSWVPASIGPNMCQCSGPEDCDCEECGCPNCKGAYNKKYNWVQKQDGWYFNTKTDQWYHKDTGWFEPAPMPIISVPRMVVSSANCSH